MNTTAYKNTALTKALSNWLVDMPRWGYTQQDELSELLSTHARALDKTRPPKDVLRHPVQLQALLDAGLKLDSIELADGETLRWKALLENAPLEVHAVLTAHGYPELAEDTFTSKAKQLVEANLFHSLRYTAHALPAPFQKVSSEGAALLTRFVVWAWEQGKHAGRPELLRVLVDEGVSKEFLLSPLVMGGLKAERLEAYRKVINQVVEASLTDRLPEARGSGRPRL